MFNDIDQLRYVDPEIFPVYCNRATLTPFQDQRALPVISDLAVRSWCRSVRTFERDHPQWWM